MTYKVEISIPALTDAENAYLWIRDENPEAAKLWFEGLLKAVFSLEEFPLRCPISPESSYLDREIRQMIYGHGKQVFKIFFEVFPTKKSVRVYRIWNTSRDWLKVDELDLTL